MDRRRFFKTILFTPFISPIFIGSKSESQDFHLYVISDSPQLFFPSILKELKLERLSSGRAFSFSNFHPEEKALVKSLSQKGWKYEEAQNKADFFLSYSLLNQPVRPSFSLIEKGRILDVRAKGLLLLWMEMSHHQRLSGRLTTLSYKPRVLNPPQAKNAWAYIEGRKVKRLYLEKNASRIFKTRKGSVEVEIRNGKVSVIQSSCIHKICMLTPPIQLPGERIICAPNHFLLEIQGLHSIDTVIG